MGVFDKYGDTSGQIKREGQEITIRFQRTGPTTGRISWNIPPTLLGCGPDATAAYDGIVITINGKASNYLTTSPKDSTYYTADPTGDPDMHAGDKIDGARVVGAFYHDKTTTYLDVTDILPKTPYFVSGYAVDAQARYHREGVHAYSLPTGAEAWGEPDRSAFHHIAIDVVGGIRTGTLTGLVADTVYNIKIMLNRKEYIIPIDGENALNYGDLVNELQEKLALLGDVYSSPIPPRANTYHFDITDGKLYFWDGYTTTDVEILVSTANPEDQTQGALWFNPVSTVLHRYANDVWNDTPYINSAINPTAIKCDQTWFDGTDVWQYKTTHWVKLHTIISLRNPLLGPLLGCDDYWYDKSDLTLNVWNLETKAWDAVDAVYFGTDPNTFTTDDYWYDESTSKVRRFASGTSWNLVTNVAYLDTLIDGEVVGAGDKTTAFIKDSGKLFIRDTNTLLWAEHTIVTFPVNPADRNAAKLWWNSTADALMVWNDLTAAWVTVTNFYQSAINPSLPAELPVNSAWHNPETGLTKLIMSTSCKNVTPISYPGNPQSPLDGTVWYDNVNKKWYSWNSALQVPAFVQVFPLYHVTNPYGDGGFVPVGYFWYDMGDMELKRYDGTGWVVVTFSASPIITLANTFWFDTTVDKLFMWNGTTWIQTIGIASVDLLQPTTSTGRSVLSFYTRDIGCAATIEVMDEAGLLMTKLRQPVIWYDPSSGETGLAAGSAYQQLGVGDDGSPDERRNHHNFIRASLGAPTMKTELTKDQLDICVDNALLILRKYSSFSYRRAVFFLDMKPNQQTYILTNSCVGFNKIVGINSLHRYAGGNVKYGGGDNEIFNAGAIQQLYALGTFDILTYHLVHAYMEELETLFARRIMFHWHEHERELKLLQVIPRKERVLVDAYIERSEQDLMTDRNTAMWLKSWALAESKKMLSQTRGKFQQIVGPNGGTTLNYAELQTQAESEMEKLMEQLHDGSMQDYANVGARAHFLMG